MDTLEILREKGFIQTAQRAMHEFDPREAGRKTDNLVIAPGDEIIVDPNVGQEDGRCWRAVEKHLSRFVANGNAFERRLGDKARQFLANAGREAQVFGSAIDRNLKEIARAGAKSLWPGIFRSSNSRANEIEVTKKLKGPTLQDFLVGKNAMPDSCLYVAEDRLALENANRCRIYEIESAGILFRIFAIFVAPFSGDGAPCDDLAVVHDLLVKENGFVKKVKDANEKKPVCTLIVLGAPCKSRVDIVPVKLDHVFEVIATPNCRRHAGGVDEWRPEYGWSISRPSIRGLAQTERPFIHSLYPQTVDELAECVRCHVDSCRNNSFTAGELCEALGLPEDDDFLIYRACNLLIEASPNMYRAFRNDDGAVSFEKGNFRGKGEMSRFPDSVIVGQRRRKGCYRWLQLVLAATVGVFIGAIAFRLLIAMGHRGYTSFVDAPKFLDGLRPKDAGFLSGIWQLTLMCLAEVRRVLWMMLGAVVPLSFFGVLRLVRDFIGRHVFNVSWHKLMEFFADNGDQ